MQAQTIVDLLLNWEPEPDKELTEATVRLPPRSTKWVAVYTGVEPGKQIWKSTGLTDRAAALALAQKWEADARAQRQALGLRSGHASLRVRHAGEPSAGGFGPLSQKDIAVLLGLSERAVRNIEKRALAKLRRHPALHELWREFETEFLESCGGLTGAEIAAIFDLAETDEERAALRHVLQAISGSAYG